MQENEESTNISEMTSEDLIQVLCETAVALYCLDIVERNNIASPATLEQIDQLKYAFGATRHEIIARCQKGARRRKAVSA